MQTPLDPQPAGLLTGQVNPAVRSQVPVTGLQTSLSQVVLEGLAQLVDVYVHVPVLGLHCPTEHGLELQFNELRELASTQIGDPLLLVHFLREHGESPGHVI
jgi:hypothetical protein